MLSVSDVINEAKRTTGLDNFGGNSFREGLEVLVKSLNRQANLNKTGLAMHRDRLISTLSRRLEIEDWYTRHPEIDEQEIVRPLIGLSLPRTGSTALHCTLAEDPAARSLRMWESDAPCPPPETTTEHTDPRIAATAKRLEMVDQLCPKLKVLIPLAPTEAVECHELMALDFKSQDFPARASVPDYVDWMLHKADLVSTYQYVKRVLKLLQWRCPPNRWRLKSPTHMPFIEALDSVFPDARFWMTHRDITQVMPSVVDTYHEVMKPLTDVVNGDYIVNTVSEWWDVGMQRTLAFRDSGQESRFIDVQFADFQRDPESCIKKIYAFLDEELTGETLQRMAEWRQKSAKDRHGRHELGSIAANMDLEKIRARFKFYSDRFSRS